MDVVDCMMNEGGKVNLRIMVMVREGPVIGIEVRADLWTNP